MIRSDIVEEYRSFSAKDRAHFTAGLWQIPCRDISLRRSGCSSLTLFGADSGSATAEQASTILHAQAH